MGPEVEHASGECYGWSGRHLIRDQMAAFFIMPKHEKGDKTVIVDQGDIESRLAF